MNRITTAVAPSVTSRASNWRRIFWQALVCVATTTWLLGRGQLHVPDTRVGANIRIPDGRTFVVFRETTRDGPAVGSSVTLAVWFRLRSIPPHALLRRWLFERLCILNTLLFAGFRGYRVKLWMVNPATSEYAGLYSWQTAETATVYGRYITAVLTPLSVSGSVGYQVVEDLSLDHYIERLAMGAKEAAAGELIPV